MTRILLILLGLACLVCVVASLRTDRVESGPPVVAGVRGAAREPVVSTPIAEPVEARDELVPSLPEPGLRVSGRWLLDERGAAGLRLEARPERLVRQLLSGTPASVARRSIVRGECDDAGAFALRLPRSAAGVWVLEARGPGVSEQRVRFTLAGHDVDLGELRVGEAELVVQLSPPTSDCELAVFERAAEPALTWPRPDARELLVELLIPTRPVARASFDTTGAASVRGLDPGEVTLAIRGPLGTLLVLDARTSSGRTRLARSVIASEVIGRVMDSSGAAMPDVRAHVVHRTARGDLYFGDVAVSDETGVLRLPRCAHARELILVQPGFENRRVTLERSTETFEVALSDAPSAVVRIVDADSGEPVADATLRAFGETGRADGLRTTRELGSEEGVMIAATATGEFLLRNGWGDGLVLVASAPGFREGAPVPWEGEPLCLELEALERCSVALEAPDRDWSRVRVMPLGSPGEAAVTPSSDGRVTLPDARARYRVEGDGLAPRVLQDACGETVSLAREALVTGVVTSSDPTLVPPYALRLESREPGCDPHELGIAVETETDDSGSFAWRGLPAGAWTLHVATWSERPHPLAPRPEAGRLARVEFTLTAGETTPLLIPIGREAEDSCRLRGQVFGLDATLGGSVLVSFRTPDGFVRTEPAVSGAFDLGRVPAGTGSLQVQRKLAGAEWFIATRTLELDAGSEEFCELEVSDLARVVCSVVEEGSGRDITRATVRYASLDRPGFGGILRMEHGSVLWLPPGSYSFLATSSDHRVEGRTVELPAAPLSFRLERVQSLPVTVLRADGERVVDRTLIVTALDGVELPPNLRLTAELGADAGFEAGALPPGLASVELFSRELGALETGTLDLSGATPGAEVVFREVP